MSIYWKAVCAFGIAVVAFLAGWKINGNRMEKQVAAIQQEHAEELRIAEEKVQEKERQYVTAMNRQADEYQQAIQAHDSDMAKLKKELKNVQTKNPLPADCRIGSDRLRIIREAGNRANGTSATAR